MPPKAPAVEDFDDDFDFALPAPPPAAGPSSAMTGAAGGPDQMAALQQMMQQMGAGAGAGEQPPMGMMMPSRPKDDPNAEHKRWIAIYPIYMDAKRPYEKGCRKVAYEKSCLYPMSIHILRALQKLGMPCVHEEWKTHPKDWENPGRVKAKLWDEAWQAKNPSIRTKKQLIEAVAKEVQPVSGGPPPPLPNLKQIAQNVQKKRRERAAAAAAAPAPAASGKKKADEAAAPRKGKGKGQAAKHEEKVAIDPIRARLRRIRHFPRAARLPPHSPAVEHGMLNVDMAGAMGGMGGNPMASMLGSLMGGGDEEEEEEPVKKEQKDPLAGIGRRQKKRMVRITR